MKKAKQTGGDELRAEYKPSDFPEGMVRGKYAARLAQSSNVVVLSPEVAAVFQTSEEVNQALLSLIKLAKASTRPGKRSPGRKKPRAA